MRPGDEVGGGSAPASSVQARVAQTTARNKRYQVLGEAHESGRGRGRGTGGGIVPCRRKIEKHGGGTMSTPASFSDGLAACFRGEGEGKDVAGGAGFIACTRGTNRANIAPNFGRESEIDFRERNPAGG